MVGTNLSGCVVGRAQRLEHEQRPVEAEEKRQHARELLGRYQQLVAKCQSPRFTREAERLDRELAVESVPPRVRDGST
jgi:hypothetical protein